MAKGKSKDDETLVGGAADDELHGGAGDDRIFGLGGDDRLFGDAGDDRLFGRGGDDIVRGGGGNDVIDGGSGDDQVHGGGGADLLIGGRADDRLEGGAGTDRFKFRPGDGDDEILDFSAEDRLDLRAFKLDGVDSALAAAEDRPMGATFELGGTTILLLGVTLAELDPAQILV